MDRDVIKKVVLMEPMKSRIPAMFPYIEPDENYYGVLHHSYDKDDGCWGMIVPDLKVSFSLIDVDNEDKVVFENGKFYSYRNLIDWYYHVIEIKNANLSDSETNRELTNEEKVFVSFIEKAIGKVSIPETITGDYVPETMYMTEMQDWIDKMDPLSSVCDCTLEGFSNDPEKCCDCSMYCASGGTAMLEFLKEQVQQIRAISDEYYGYALDDEGKFHGGPSMNILLTDENEYFGYMEPYSEEFVPGKRYHVGEVVFYEGVSWILWMGSGGTNFTLNNYFDENRDKEEEGFFYYGHYDPVSCKIVFDSNENVHWRRNVVNQKELAEYGLTESAMRAYYKANDESFPDNSFYVTERDSYDDSVKDNIADMVLTGQTESKLQSLRRVSRLVDSRGNVSAPDSSSNEDWCCLYQVGLVTNIVTWTDDNGNIAYYDTWDSSDSGNIHVTSDEPNEVLDNVDGAAENDEDKGYKYKLLAFGDVIDKIEIVDNYHIRFTYHIGAHLIGEVLDGTGNVTNTVVETSRIEPTYYRFNHFSIDPDHLGSTYEDTYTFEAGTIVQAGDDTTNANGVYDLSKVPMDNVYQDAETGDNVQIEGVFSTTYAKTVVYSEYGLNGMLRNIPSANFNLKRTEPDYVLTKPLVWDYFMGITDRPRVDTEVVLDRGLNAAYERHLKLGEIRTMQDLEEYGNGFFNIQTAN